MLSHQSAKERTLSNEKEAEENILFLLLFKRHIRRKKKKRDTVTFKSLEDPEITLGKISSLLQGRRLKRLPRN